MHRLRDGNGEMGCLRDGVVGIFLISDEDNERSQGHHNTLILCVGELTDIGWAWH